MKAPKDVTPHGRRGSRCTVKTQGKTFDIDPYDEVILMPNPTNQPMASVGCALTVGQSTQFGAEKLEVAAWCTLPCAPDEASMREAYAECYRFVESEIADRADAAMARFFPDLLEKKS